MKILIDTVDRELFENIKNVFKGTSLVSIYKKSLKNIDDFGIIILDNFSENTLNIANFKDKLIINIANSTTSNDDKIVNFRTPFRLMDLIRKIEYHVDYNSKNVVKFDFGVFNFNEKIFKNNDKEVVFTEKENNLVKYIVENKNSTKEDIILNVWNRGDQENKLVETTLYNIRQKLKDAGQDDFISVSDNKYSVREIK